mmetsp:Transcript_5397/g.9335  ORF Transcript_5397/g.9335 Transcript_5397/m.9335 type:complete len:143 (+) Transcript_5397:126-554(+)|eukprot:CAMPEP_0119105732 /NCGR_PEP_ID=MMETSP1180-20130426/3624_1 /TAXON_ID=3052 ORGANISM="Chlamydomonas cf sp, Strain CCMP681" /NCGR_SAMPLE_ID=MMETSP1180 /ASSEMBLY_ACC=CAM_ASM_000741 /LENGTH=142 /DNA_ID=CAMNT_0007090869 /DNA_START=126 /DNA_END=554 /DNA_ORIENTATION=-
MGREEKSRKYRRQAHNEEEERAAAAAAAAAARSVRAGQLASLEEEVLAAVEVAVLQKVAELSESEEVQRRILSRLKEERAKLEAAVTAQLEEERAALLHKKRREQDEAKKRQEELERILGDNMRKVQEAQARAAQAAQRSGQ